MCPPPRKEKHVEKTCFSFRGGGRENNKKIRDARVEAMAVEIKICGLTTEDAMAAALDNGADYVGLVFFPKSPRHVSLAQAQDLAAMARGRAQVVALTVDPEDALLDQIVEIVAPDMIQLHGNETPERVATIAERTGCPCLKAIKVATRADLAASQAYREAAHMLLFDAKPTAPDALPGGNGVPFDWRLLVEFPLPTRYMLSGGLTPENVGAALERTRAPILDVSSGVESAPGRKDPDRIKHFIETARAMDRQLQRDRPHP